MSLNNVVFKRKKILCLRWSTSAVSKNPSSYHFYWTPQKIGAAFSLLSMFHRNKKKLFASSPLCCSIFTSGFLGILFGVVTFYERLCNITQNAVK